MTKDFGNHQYASDFARIMERVAVGVVRRERPDIRLGKVYNFNSQTGFADVLFAGDTLENLVKVKAAKNMQPTTMMISTFESEGYGASGDIVRVAGKPGSYFILDYASGVPSGASAGGGGGGDSEDIISTIIVEMSDPQTPLGERFKLLLTGENGVGPEPDVNFVDTFTTALLG